MVESNKPKILLVDDDETFLKAMGKTLIKEGYDVTLASNGYEALQLAKTASFDLVISDVRMPEMDGIESLSEIKKVQPASKFIVITGYTTEDSALRAERIGTSAFFYKPLEMEDFLKSVRHFITLVQKSKTQEEQSRGREEQYLELIKGLILAILAQDKNLSDRLAIRKDILNTLAKHYHLPKNEHQMLELAAYLADLQILEENTKLKIQLLPIKTLLKDNLLFEPLAPILKFQSEPFEVNKERIPFQARMLAVSNGYADIAVNSTHSRSEILSLLKNKSGTVYDPSIIESLLKILSEQPEDNALFKETQNIFKSTREQTASLLALGSFYRDVGDAQISIEAYEEVLNLQNKLPDERAQALALLGIAKCHIINNNIPEALHSARQGLEICTHNRFSQIETQTLLILSNCCLQQNNFDAAQKFLEQTRLLLNRWKSPNELAHLLLEETYLQLAMNEKENAQKSWTQSLQTLEALDNHSILLEEKNILSKLVGAFVDDKENINKLLDLSKKLEERALEFIHAIVSPLAEKERLSIMRLIKDRFGAPATTEMLRVFTLGPVRIYRSGTLIEEKEWHIKKPKYLLIFLLANQSKHLTDEFLMETFWPNMPGEKAKNNLHHTIHHLRKILEPHKKDTSLSLYIHRQGNLYYFNPQAPYKWDVNIFEETFSKGEEFAKKGDVDNAIQAFTAIGELYQGDFLLDNLEDEWVILLRDRLQQKFHNGLIRLAKSLFNKKEINQAIEYTERVLNENPYNEEAFVVTMECLIGLSQHNEAIKCYNKYKKIMKSELKLPPSKKMEELYQLTMTKRTS